MSLVFALYDFITLPLAKILSRCVHHFLSFGCDFLSLVAVKVRGR